MKEKTKDKVANQNKMNRKEGTRTKSPRRKIIN
jgi:hypothetical protein